MSNKVTFEDKLRHQAKDLSEDLKEAIKAMQELVDALDNPANDPADIWCTIRVKVIEAGGHVDGLVEPLDSFYWILDDRFERLKYKRKENL